MNLFRRGKPPPNTSSKDQIFKSQRDRAHLACALIINEQEQEQEQQPVPTNQNENALNNSDSALDSQHDKETLPQSETLLGQVQEIRIEHGLQNDQIEKDGKVLSKSSKSSVNLDDFTVHKLIGSGGYGKVYLVQKKDNTKFFAMKVLKKASILLHQRQIAFAKAERTILELVQHPFIVKLYYAFQSNSRLYLIMDYISGGELFYHMAKERIFTEDQAAFYVAEIAIALDHLHNLGIIYRDLKPENILLNSNGHLVLTDFGLSKNHVSTDQDGDENPKTNTFCGTPSYMAPEIFDLNKPYEKSVDWWSLGILTYEMLTGKVPFKGKSHKQVYDTIMKRKLVFPKYVSPDAADFMRKLLKKNPEQRLGYGKNSLEKIKKHRFFTDIDWKSLTGRHEDVIPPIAPQVSSEGDVSCFDTFFTDQTISLFSDTPLQKIRNATTLAEHLVLSQSAVNIPNISENTNLKSEDSNLPRSNNPSLSNANLYIKISSLATNPNYDSSNPIAIPINTKGKKADARTAALRDQNPVTTIPNEGYNNSSVSEPGESTFHVGRNSEDVFSGFSYVAQSTLTKLNR